MPTIVKRETGYQARVRLRGISRSATFDKRADAAAWARQIEVEIEKGRLQETVPSDPYAKTRLVDLLERYQTEVSPQKRGATREISVLHHLAQDPLAQRPLRTLDTPAVLDYSTRAKTRFAASTVTRRLALLSHVIETARKLWGYTSLKNPCRDIPKPKSRSRTRTASASEIEALCEASHSPHLALIIRLATETAMRRGEIVDLRWEHIHLDGRVAHLPLTKNGEARDVPLSANAVRLIESIGAQQIEDQHIPDGQTRPRHPAQGRVFGIRADAITRAFDRARVRARQRYEAACIAQGQQPDAAYLLNLRFHDLRHTAITRIAGKLSMHETMRVSGHRTPAMLARYYHPKPLDLAAKLDAL